MSAGDTGRKRARHSRRAQSREKTPRESRRSKLRTSRPGRLWLFTHSAAAPAGDRPHAKKENPAAWGRAGLVVGTCPSERWGPDPRNQPLGCGVTVTDWRLWYGPRRSLAKPSQADRRSHRARDRCPIKGVGHDGGRLTHTQLPATGAEDSRPAVELRIQLVLPFTHQRFPLRAVRDVLVF